MSKRVQRPGIRDGYDRWSQTYDHTPNPLVALDRRYTMPLLQPRPAERILDAGCGTGGDLGFIVLPRSPPLRGAPSPGGLTVAPRQFTSSTLAHRRHLSD